MSPTECQTCKIHGLRNNILWKHQKHHTFLTETRLVERSLTRRPATAQSRPLRSLGRLVPGRRRDGFGGGGPCPGRELGVAVAAGGAAITDVSSTLYNARTQAPQRGAPLPAGLHKWHEPNTKPSRSIELNSWLLLIRNLHQLAFHGRTLSSATETTKPAGHRASRV